MELRRELEILPYRLHPASYHEWDSRAPAVAALLIRTIEAEIPQVTVEHIGSTSVPGCGGKGIIDLMLMYPPGGMEAARDALDRSGFQHQISRHPFSEERPMRVAAVNYDGAEFRTHVHVIAADSPEVEEFRIFRDALLRNPDLITAYTARKHEILAAGITDAYTYTKTKGSFCQDVLADLSAQSST
ncbi:MAG TPA: GrpB family protein [Chloroflexota bacterium]